MFFQNYSLVLKKIYMKISFHTKTSSIIMKIISMEKKFGVCIVSMLPTMSWSKTQYNYIFLTVYSLSSRIQYLWQTPSCLNSIGNLGNIAQLLKEKAEIFFICRWCESICGRCRGREVLSFTCLYFANKVSKDSKP